MTSSGLIHGIGTSVPPQKRSSVETVTSRPRRAAARVGRRIGGSCRGGGAARPNTMRGDAARRSEGDGLRRAPGGARAGGGRAARRRGLRGRRRTGGGGGRGLSGRGLRGGGGEPGRQRVRGGRRRGGGEPVAG